MSNEKTITTRRRLKMDYELPFGDDYGEFILGFLEDE